LKTIRDRPTSASSGGGVGGGGGGGGGRGGGAAGGGLAARGTDVVKERKFDDYSLYATTKDTKCVCFFLHLLRASESE
jgi:hypothetical protein